MSYSSVLQIGSQGDLGATKASVVFAPVALVSGVATPISNTLYLEQGIWSLQKTITFTTNADNTTEIGSLIVVTTNEIGNINTQTLIANGVTAGAYPSETLTFNITDISRCPNYTLNEFVASITWTGAGSAPTCSCLLTAVKLV